eukprot:6345985-Amphidinium_carterae.1
MEIETQEEESNDPSDAYLEYLIAKAKWRKQSGPHRRKKRFIRRSSSPMRQHRQSSFPPRQGQHRSGGRNFLSTADKSRGMAGQKPRNPWTGMENP